MPLSILSTLGLALTSRPTDADLEGNDHARRTAALARIANAGDEDVAAIEREYGAKLAEARRRRDENNARAIETANATARELGPTDAAWFRDAITEPLLALTRGERSIEHAEAIHARTVELGARTERHLGEIVRPRFVADAIASIVLGDDRGWYGLRAHRATAGLVARVDAVLVAPSSIARRGAIEALVSMVAELGAQRETVARIDRPAESKSHGQIEITLEQLARRHDLAANATTDRDLRRVLGDFDHEAEREHDVRRNAAEAERRKVYDARRREGDAPGTLRDELGKVIRHVVRDGERV